MDFVRNNLIWVILAIVVLLLLITGLQNPSSTASSAAVTESLKDKTKENLDAEKKIFEKSVQEKKKLENEYSKALKQMNDLDRRWDDAFKIANATSKIALSQPVSNLQAILREAESQILPQCYANANIRRTLGMKNGIESFLIFMTEDNKYLREKRATELFEEQQRNFRTYRALKGECGV